jgi:thymidylate kinase
MVEKVEVEGKKNRLVQIEGVDGAGKTTVIKDLKEKYPEIHIIRFPTQRLRDLNKGYLGHEHKFETIGDLLQYHYQFLEDFVSEQEKIYNLIQSNTLVLLDRYACSNYVYMLYDLVNFYGKNGDKVMDIFKPMYQSLIEFYKELQDPSLFIYLEKPDWLYQNEERDRKLCFLYSLVIKANTSTTTDIVTIKGLQDDTFEKVESVLKERGYPLSPTTTTTAEDVD